MALACATLSGMAQEGITQQEKDQNKKAEVVSENGQQRLVLKTGRGPSTGLCAHLSSIELTMDGEIWITLDSLTTAPIGGDAVFIKDVRGYNVKIIRAYVDSKPGLMFISGTNFFAITIEEFRELNR